MIPNFPGFTLTFITERPLPPELKLVLIIEIGCEMNCHNPVENFVKNGQILYFLCRNFEKVATMQFLIENHSDWTQKIFTEVAENLRISKKGVF